MDFRKWQVQNGFKPSEEKERSGMKNFTLDTIVHGMDYKDDRWDEFMFVEHFSDFWVALERLAEVTKKLNDMGLTKATGMGILQVAMNYGAKVLVVELKDDQHIAILALEDWSNATKANKQYAGYNVRLTAEQQKE